MLRALDFSSPGMPFLPRTNTLSHKHLTSTLALGGLLFLAFGSVPSDDASFEEMMEEAAAEAVEGAAAGSGGSNSEACKAYVQHYNSLSCMGAMNLSESDMCPDALDLGSSDMTPYWECMKTNSKCNGDMPDVMGQLDCIELL